MASSTIKIPSATYANKSRAISYGAVTSVTPSRDGWLVAVSGVSEAQTVPPVIRIMQDGSRIAEGIGMTSSGTTVSCGAPVKAGKTYTIEIYRITLGSVTLY